MYDYVIKETVNKRNDRKLSVYIIIKNSYSTPSFNMSELNFILILRLSLFNYFNEVSSIFKTNIFKQISIFQEIYCMIYILFQYKPENAIKKFKYTEKRVYIVLKDVHEKRIGEMLLLPVHIFKINI